MLSAGWLKALSWMYSNFIESDGLADALKAAGLGIMIAGRRVPLLMYADDVVMLASSVDELTRMNAIATKFAQQHAPLSVQRRQEWCDGVQRTEAGARAGREA